MKRLNLLFFVAVFTMFCVGFSSCKKDDKNDSKNVLEDQYFTLQNGVYHSGTIPSSPSGISIADCININSTAINGGSSYVSISPGQQISEVYASVQGVNSYYSIQPQSSSMGDVVTYSFVILFSQNLSESFNIMLSARLSNGSLTGVYNAVISHIEAGTGSLQVSLSFDNDKDLDLYVVQPDGEVIYYGNTGDYSVENGVITGWGLDLDSNPACSIDGVNNENVFFSKDYIQPGKYQVWVNVYENCDPSIPTNWVITALNEGALLPVTYGHNPASGVFPVGTPSNEIGDELTGATKVMEFTLANVSHVSGINRVAPFRSHSPLTESAKLKLTRAGKLIEN